MSRPSSGLIVFLVACFVVWGIGASLPVEAAADGDPPPKPTGRVFISLNSGPQSSGWYIVAGLVAEEIERALPGVRVTNVVGNPVRNTRDVDAGRADLGLEFQWLAVEAVNGRPPFDAPVENVSVISNFYPTYFQMFARADSGIRSYHDLRGKRIGVGQAGTSGDMITQRIFELHGFTYDDIRASGGSISFNSYDDAKQMIADGHLDAFTISSTVPNPQAVELQLTQDLRLVPLDEAVIDRYLATYPGFSKATIPAGSYKNQPEDVLSLTVPAIVVVRNDLPENLVYWITKSWWDNARNIADAYDVIKEDFYPELAVKDLAIPQHPGAQRYFREIGVLE